MKNSYKNQYFATICINLPVIAYGIQLGWASPTIPLLLSENSPLPSGPLTISDAAWITSIFCVGGLVGSIFFGWSADRLGRRGSMLIYGLPQLISWLLILFGTNPYYLYVSRILMGFVSGGMFVILPIFITEISENRIRGFLGSSLILTCNLGILIGYVICDSIYYFHVPYFGIFFTAMFMFGILFLPETPQFLFNHNRCVEGEHSLRFYRNIGEDKNQNKPPLNYLIELDNLKQISMNSKLNKIDENKITLKDFQLPSTQKGILIGGVLMLMTQLCGTFGIMNYTASIFKSAGSTLHPNICAIIVGVIQLIGSYFSTILVERLGRKILLILSSFGTGLGLMTMGIYSYLQYHNYDVSSFNWLPLVSLSEVSFIACFGIIPLAFVVTAEILPPKLRSLMPSIFMSFLWCLAFVYIKYFNDLIWLMEMHGCMWLFAGSCFFETIFVIFLLPETKGKSFDEIQKIL